MLGKALFLIAVLAFACPVLGSILAVEAQSMQAITIHPDGTVTPPNAAIQTAEKTYTLTTDRTVSIIVEKSGIVIDGANHTLQGLGNQQGVGLNLTAENVTVQNLHITNWQAGILGAWNNNTITHNSFTNNSISVAIYADDYVITENIVASSDTGLWINGGGFRPQGDNNLVTQNQIVGNRQAFDISNSNGTTITGNNVTNNSIILTLATTSSNSYLYLNNFVNNSQILNIPSMIIGGHGPFVSPAGQWDNGTIGNYWSDYWSVYSNASEIGNSGIANTPYQINDTVTDNISYPNGTDVTLNVTLGTAVDRYPLLSPVPIKTPTTPWNPQASPPQTTSTPNPTAAPATPSPSPSPLQSPTPSPAISDSPQTQTPAPSVPEFPTLVALLLTMSATLMAVWLVKQKRAPR